MAGFDPNEHFRERRRRRQRQIRIRRTVAIGILLAAVAGIALGARAVGSGHHPVAHPRQLQSSTAAPRAACSSGPRAGSERGPGRPRHDGARFATRQAPAVPRHPRPECDRARRQGRERPRRVHPAQRPARDSHRRRGPLLQREARRPARAFARHLPDRPRGHVRGSGALGEAARPGRAHAGRLRLAHERRSRLDEPVRPARLALRRRHRGSRREGRLRRDPVRLRPLPERRRSLADPVSGPASAGDEMDDSRLRQVRGQAPAPAARARLGRRLRALGDA